LSKAGLSGRSSKRVKPFPISHNQDALSIHQTLGLSIPVKVAGNHNVPISPRHAIITQKPRGSVETVLVNEKCRLENRPAVRVYGLKNCRADAADRSVFNAPQKAAFGRMSG